MKILIAPDSFKGSLTASQICDIVEKAGKEVFPNCEFTKIPVADGGEGTLESIITRLNGDTINLEVLNPLQQKVTAQYGIFGDNAVIEMASASGLPLIKKEERNVLKSNTFGTGELVLDAINRGIKTIYIGLGGSATNDGGIGFASAIGVKFKDKNGEILQAIPENFLKINSIDISEINSKIKDVKFIIMSDVKNPLLGETGATNIFGRQKGESEIEVELLENGLKHYISIVEKALNKTVQNIEGSGSAGGLGAGILAFTNAEIRSGVDTILEILNFEKEVQNSSLVITGEGMMDYQSAFGKLAFGVGKICKKNNIPCIALVGGLGKNYEEMFEHGISSMICTVDSAMNIETAMKNSETLCYKASIRMFNLMKISQNISV